MGDGINEIMIKLLLIFEEKILVNFKPFIKTLTVYSLYKYNKNYKK